MMEYTFCDIHSHILPGMDDGCKDSEQSLQLLQAAWDQGVRCQFLTPHYYPVESVESFLHRREHSWQRLCARMEQVQTELPELCLGAEVAYRPGISYEEQMEKLCLGNSRYLLLEMPFRPWSDSVIRDVANISRTQGITPVIAHVERYLHYQTKDILRKLWEQEVLIQMNAEHLLDPWTRRKALRLLDSGVVHLLGTDAHNTTTRQPNLGKAAQLLINRKRAGMLQQIMASGVEIFHIAAQK